MRFVTYNIQYGKGRDGRFAHANRLLLPQHAAPAAPPFLLDRRGAAAPITAGVDQARSLERSHDGPQRLA